MCIRDRSGAGRAPPGRGPGRRTWGYSSGRNLRRPALPLTAKSGNPLHSSPIDEEARYRIALVCLGNICRSPTAHVVLQSRLDAAGLSDRVEVVSAGTGGWHTGEPMDKRAATVLT